MAKTNVDPMKVTSNSSSEDPTISPETFDKMLRKPSNIQLGSMTHSPPATLCPVDFRSFDRAVSVARSCYEMKKRAEKALLKEQEAYEDAIRELKGYAKFVNPEKIKNILQKYDK